MECIDILMATYNGEKYLKEQIDSILNQTYKNFRLIISDDCSTDNTRKILKEYEKIDSRIEVIFQEKNLGLVKNFESLIKRVNNKYFMFSDQDDFWKSNKIELSMNILKKEKSDLVYTDLEVVDQNLNQISESYWKLKKFYKKIKKYNNFNSLYLNNFITGCTMLIKSEWIDKILPIPKDSKYILHDYWFALIISQSGKISYLEEQTIKYRQHGNNSVGYATKSEQLNSLEEIRKLFIEVKVDHFNVFIQNEDKFKNDSIKKLNKKALKYYEYLQNVNKFSVFKINLFFKLYKYEDFGYKMKNLIILHFPGIAKIIFYKLKKNSIKS